MLGSPIVRPISFGFSSVSHGENSTDIISCSGVLSKIFQSDAERAAAIRNILSSTVSLFFIKIFGVIGIEISCPFL